MSRIINLLCDRCRSEVSYEKAVMDKWVSYTYMPVTNGATPPTDSQERGHLCRICVTAIKRLED